MRSLQAQYSTFIAMQVTMAARSKLACYEACTSNPAKKHSLALAKEVLQDVVRDLYDKHVTMEAKRSIVK